MTGEQRAELRQAVDRARRARLQLRVIDPKKHCKSCGIPFEETPTLPEQTGCLVCRDRIYGKRKRQKMVAGRTHTRTHGLCAACNGPTADVNTECYLCRDRYRKRRLRAQGPIPRLCSKCGGNRENVNRGCRTCYERHHRRLRMYRQEAA